MMPQEYGIDTWPSVRPFDAVVLCFALLSSDSFDRAVEMLLRLKYHFFVFCLPLLSLSLLSLLTLQR
jgi:hypothetical protein